MVEEKDTPSIGEMTSEFLAERGGTYCIVCHAELSGHKGSAFHFSIRGEMVITLFSCPNHAKMEVLYAAEPLLNQLTFYDDETSLTTLTEER